MNQYGYQCWYQYIDTNIVFATTARIYANRCLEEWVLVPFISVEGKKMKMIGTWK